MAEVCRRHGLSANTYYLWKRKFAGLDVPDAKRMRQLEEENRRLKSIVAEYLSVETVVAGVQKISKLGG